MGEDNRTEMQKLRDRIYGDPAVDVTPTTRQHFTGVGAPLHSPIRPGYTIPPKAPAKK